MNVNMNASVALASATGQNTGDAVGLSVLKKAIDMQAQSAAALVNALSQPEKNSTNLPPNLGQNVNTTA